MTNSYYSNAGIPIHSQEGHPKEGAGFSPGTQVKHSCPHLLSTAATMLDQMFQLILNPSLPPGSKECFLDEVWDAWFVPTNIYREAGFARQILEGAVKDNFLNTEIPCKSAWLEVLDVLPFSFLLVQQYDSSCWATPLKWVNTVGFQAPGCRLAQVRLLWDLGSESADASSLSLHSNKQKVLNDKWQIGWNSS